MHQVTARQAHSELVRIPFTTAQLFLGVAIIAGATAGFLATDAQSSSHAVALSGADLTRLLRAMALLKCAMALGAAAAVFWRLTAPVSLPCLAGYAAACLAMAAGPGLIWGMVHVGAGALLLHGGLLATILLVWRDPAVASRLESIVRRRRAALRQ